MNLDIQQHRLTHLKSPSLVTSFSSPEKFKLQYSDSPRQGGSSRNLTNRHARLTSEDLPSKHFDINNKVITLIHNSGQKITNEIAGISHQIYESKLPFVSYYHPDSEMLKSRKEMIVEMENNFEFFKGFSPRTKFYQAKVKDFYVEQMSPRILSPRAKVGLSKVNEFLQGKDLSLKTAVSSRITLTETSSPNDGIRKLGLLTPPNRMMTEEAPETEQDDQTVTMPSLRRKPKIKYSIAEGAYNRKKLLQDMRKIGESKTEQTEEDERPAYTVLDKRDSMPSALHRQKNRKAKLDLCTKSPFKNAYYQILAMPQTQRAHIMNRLEMTPVNNGNMVKKQSKIASQR